MYLILYIILDRCSLRVRIHFNSALSGLAARFVWLYCYSNITRQITLLCDTCSS